MGMPLTKYSMLKALGSDEPGYINDMATKLLSKYKLFGLVLHDPVEHAGFHRKLELIFDKLDYITGSDFLFFSLTTPPGVDEYRQRDYFRAIYDTELDPANAYSTDDEGISSFMIASSLGISLDSLPCIVLIPHFLTENFLCIKSGEKFIEEQLSQIGYYCKRSPVQRIYLFDQSFKDMVRDIDYYHESDYYKTSRPLANVLADDLSFLAYGDKQDDSSLASKNVIEILNKSFRQESKQNQEIETHEIDSLALLAKIAHLGKKQGYLNYFEEEGEPYSLDSLGILPFPSARKKSEPISDISNAYDYLMKLELEPDSKIILRTTNQVRNVYEQGIIDYPHPELDHSAIIIGLAKVFEKELNLSVVQWVRTSLGIEMPEYFNLLKPGSSNYTMTPSVDIIPNPRPIDFNRGRDRWNPPSLGESELVLRSLFREGRIINELSSQQSGALMESWRGIRSIRNRAAHSEVINKLVCDEMYTHYYNLIIQKIFDSFIQLKKNYSGVLP